MIDGKELIPVLNRFTGSAGYKIDESGIKRRFTAGETKRIPMDELRQLSWVPGGLEMLSDVFVILNQEAVEEILGDVEPEYFYTEKEIERLLLSGSIDALEDCLNFAPQGVLDLVKKIAVKIKLNSIDKRELIQNKLGLNITKAIEINEETKEENKTEKKVRKVAINKDIDAATEAPVEDKPQRKTAAPQTSAKTVSWKDVLDQE